MRPMIVRARMAESVVCYGDGLHLDGPLAYGAFCDLPRGQREALPPISDAWALDLDLPLARWEGRAQLLDDQHPRLTVDGAIEERDGEYWGTVWGWRASAAIHEGGVAHGTCELRKKVALAEMVGWTDARSHNVGMGAMRAKNLRFPQIFAPVWQWYAVGDPDRVRYLLARHVHAIGKLSKQGPGVVAEWTVEEVAEDRSTVWEGRPMRRLPAAMLGTGTAQSSGSIRPPYHHRSRMCWTVEPQCIQV